MAHDYRHRCRVEFADTDCAGIVHFSRYLCYAEETEHAFLRSLGMSVHREVDGYALGFPRLAVRFQYHRALKFEDEFDVVLRVRRIGKTSLTYEFLFSRAAESIACGEFTVICCRVYADGRIEPAALPADLADRLEESSEDPLEFRSA